MTITFSKDGQGHCLFTEEIELAQIGTLSMRRATNIEFNQDTQKWEVRLPQARGEPHAPDFRVIYTHASRETCLAWEKEFFNQ